AVNDVIYMTVLLLCCEALYYFGGKTSTRTSLGLAKKAPWLGMAVILGTMAASGIPPFNGFQSELILIQAALKVGLPEVAAVILMVSVTTFIALFRAVYRLFLKPPETSETVTEVKVPRALYIGLWFFVAMTLIIGVYPTIVVSFITPVAQAVSIPWYL
ncbi:MAG: proton-conducting transporter membrane subunit, partial [Candidatus Methanomethylicaceae archaeon]